MNQQGGGAMSRAKRLIVAGIVAAGMLGGTAGSALAHDIYAFNPPDPSVAAYLDHRRLVVCDQQVDGRVAYIRFTVHGGHGYFYGPRDSTDPGCGYEPLITHLKELWLCIEGERCGRGVRHD
jgi:hypothetical protein